MEEAEPAAEAALRCGARRMVQIANSINIRCENNRQQSKEITAMKNRADFMLTRPPDELREAEPVAEVALLCGARTRRGGRISFCKFQHWLSRKQSTALLTAEEEEKEALDADEAAPLCGAWRGRISLWTDQPLRISTFVLKKTIDSKS